ARLSLQQSSVEQRICDGGSDPRARSWARVGRPRLRDRARRPGERWFVPRGGEGRDALRGHDRRLLRHAGAGEARRRTRMVELTAARLAAALIWASVPSLEASIVTEKGRGHPVMTRNADHQDALTRCRRGRGKSSNRRSQPDDQKGPVAGAFRVAGAGFEPATSGL